VLILEDRGGKWADYSLPGTRIYLSSGELKRSEFENEVAAAIAVQLAHVARRHAVIRLTRDPEIARLDGSVIESVMPVAPPGSGNVSVDFFGPKGIFAFSQENRLDAADMAVDILYRAGFDPRGLILFWTNHVNHLASSPYDSDLLQRLIERSRAAIAQRAVKRVPGREEEDRTAVNEFVSEVRQMVDVLVQSDEEASNWVKQSKTIESLVRIPGDASTRRYYRVQSAGKSYILMRMEPFVQEGMGLPFLVVQKHLYSANVDVPAILDVDPARGFMLLEDLGDITLLRRLQEVCSADVERHLYERVIDSLVNLQVFASPKRKPAEIDSYKLRFDFEKLMWEVNFCIEHFYEGYLKRKLSDEDKRVMVEGFGEICQTLADEPTVFTHRDFHSRNIMVAPAEGDKERLVMIDFQDARLGPAVYDLASLLKDSYYQLEEVQIERLLDYYIARYEAASGEGMDRAHLRKMFDLMSVQRNFKAIGSFASFLMKRGDPGYLKYIGNTFENIRRTLIKYPQYARLREVLFHYYYF